MCIYVTYDGYVVRGNVRKSLLEEVGLGKIVGVDHGDLRREHYRHSRHRILWPETQKYTPL